MHCTIGCSICTDTISNNEQKYPCSLDCGHVFHESCVIQWGNTVNGARCPICREGNCRKRNRLYLFWEDIPSEESNDMIISQLREDLANAKKRHMMALNHNDSLEKELNAAKVCNSSLAEQLERLAKENVKYKQLLAEKDTSLSQYSKKLMVLHQKVSGKDKKIKELDSHLKMIMAQSQGVEMNIEPHLLQNKEFIINTLKTHYLLINQYNNEKGKLLMDLKEATKNCCNMEANLAKCKDEHIKYQTIIDSLKETINKIRNEKNEYDGQHERTSQINVHPRLHEQMECNNSSCAPSQAQPGRSSTSIYVGLGPTSSLEEQNNAKVFSSCKSKTEEAGPSSMRKTNLGRLRACKVILKKPKRN